MTARIEEQEAALRCADAQVKSQQANGSAGGKQAPMDPGQYRWALVQAFREGARHGRATATRDFVQTLSAEIDERCRWQRLAIGLSRELDGGFIR